MADKVANIDLLFRNGLRDLEVLPPSEVWNNIKPVIRKKQQPYVFLRNAAMIAVLLSLSFLAYKWSKDISSMTSMPQLAINEANALIQPSSASVTRPASNIQYDRIIPSNDRTAASNEQLNYNEPVLPVSDDNNINRARTDFLSESTGREIFTRQFNPEVNNTPFEEIYTGQNYSYYDWPNTLAVEDEKKTNKWSIAAMASPSYFPKTATGPDELSKQIAAAEQTQISYSGGVAFSYNISRKLSIQSGLYYSSVGQELDGIHSFGGFQKYDYTKGDHNFEVLTSSGKVYTSNRDIFLMDGYGDRVLTRYTNDVFDPVKADLKYLNSSLHQSFSYVEMPVILRYKLVDKALDVNLIGGLSYNLLINNSVYTMIDGSRYVIGKTEGLNQIMFSSSIGMGMEYNLSEKFSLNLEPTFRYYINPFTQIQGVRIHPYSIGIFSGLSYKF